MHLHVCVRERAIERESCSMGDNETVRKRKGRCYTCVSGGGSSTVDEVLLLPAAGEQGPELSVALETDMLSPTSVHARRHTQILVCLHSY